MHLLANADERGALLPIEFSALPFQPQRLFVVTDAPAGTVRGGHGPAVGGQLLVATRGSIGVIVQRRSGARERCVLQTFGATCLLGAGDVAWQRYADASAQLLVLAEAAFDPDGYVYSDAVPTDAEWAELFG